MSNYYDEQEKQAVARVVALLDLPTAVDDNWSEGEVFDPWSLFPCLYGSYSSDFDDLAIAVLTDIRDRTHKRTDLAAEMFREMLCKQGLCDYGTSPRVCFPATEFEPFLPTMIVRWTEYAKVQWKEDYAHAVATDRQRSD